MIKDSSEIKVVLFENPWHGRLKLYKKLPVVVVIYRKGVMGKVRFFKNAETASEWAKKLVS